MNIIIDSSESLNTFAFNTSKHGKIPVSKLKDAIAKGAGFKYLTSFTDALTPFEQPIDVTGAIQITETMKGINDKNERSLALDVTFSEMPKMLRLSHLGGLRKAYSEHLEYALGNFDFSDEALEQRICSDNDVSSTDDLGMDNLNQANDNVRNAATRLSNLDDTSIAYALLKANGLDGVADAMMDVSESASDCDYLEQFI